MVLTCSCDLCQPLSEYIWTSGKLTFESSPYDVQGNARVRLLVDQTRNAVQYQLTIDNFGPADQGSYSCILSNAHGADSFVMQARLMVAPQIDGILIDNELQELKFVGLEDSVHQLTCEAAGLPEPLLTWTLNGRTLQEGNRYTLLNDNKTLYLNEKFDETYNGNYKCIATNPIGVSSGEISLRYGSPPVFVVLPKNNVNIDVGQQLSLDCLVEGVPDPELVWYFNDQLVEKDQPYKMTLGDSGIYKCMATNEFGQISASSTVVVYGKPEFSVNSTEDEAIVVSKEEDLFLDCKTSGFPEVS